MASPQAADAGSSGAGNSDSEEYSRLLKKYKALNADNLKLEEIIGERKAELAEERKKVETKDKEIQQLKKTATEQKDELECKAKLIDELKANMAKMEIDFTAKLETEKKARRLERSAIRNDCYLKLEQNKNVLAKLRNGEQEMRNEMLKRNTTIKELRTELEKKVTECSTYKTSAKKTIEALEKQLLDYEKSQMKLEKILRKKQAKIATLNSCVEEGNKTILEVVEKHKRICSALLSQEDSDFEELNEDPALSVENNDDDQQTEEAHFRAVERTSSCETESIESSSLNSPSTSHASSPRLAEAQESLSCKITRIGSYIVSSISGADDDNCTTDNRIDSIISEPEPIWNEEWPPLEAQINDQPESRSSNSPEVSEETHSEALSSIASSSKTCSNDAAGEHKTKGKGNFSCNVCKERFQRHCDLVSHLWRVHELKNKETDGKFGCRTPGCGALLPSLKALWQHKLLAHNIGQSIPKSLKLRRSKRKKKKSLKIRDETPGNSQATSVPQPTFTWTSSKHAQDKSREQGFFCICGREFHLKNYLAAHINNLTLKKKFPCDICGEKFVSYGNVNAHKRNKHRMDTGPKGKIGCNFCGIVFPSKRCYAQHRIKKFLNGRIIDAYCPSQGPESRNVETNSLSESLNDRPEMDGPFQQLGDEISPPSIIVPLGPPTLEPETDKSCKKCGKEFMRAELLSKHVVSVHKNNVISCKKCKQVFPTNMELYDHHKMIHNLGSQLESWERIGPLLPRLPFIKIEPVESSPPGDDDIVEAEQLQVANEQAEAHHPVPLDPLDTASGKRHKCSCGNMYAAKCSLRLHIQMKTNGKIFKCSWCSASFDLHCNLKKHVIRIHKQEYKKSFACHDCAQTFSTMDDIRNHRRKMHGSISRNQTEGTGWILVL